MSQYDNKSSAFAWRYTPKQGEETKLVAKGSIIDTTGISSEMVLLRQVTKNGMNLLRIMMQSGSLVDDSYEETSKVWTQVGTLFKNDTDNERAQKFTGTTNIPKMERASCWIGDKDGKNYMSIKFQPPYQEDVNKDKKEHPAGLDDEIPF